MPSQRRAKFVICHLCQSASGDCLDLMNEAGTFVPFLPSISPERSRQITLLGQLLPFWQSSGSQILSKRRLLILLIRLQMVCFHFIYCWQGWSTELWHAYMSSTPAVEKNHSKLNKCGNLWGLYKKYLHWLSSLHKYFMFLRTESKDYRILSTSPPSLFSSPFIQPLKLAWKGRWSDDIQRGTCRLCGNCRGI